MWSVYNKLPVLSRHSILDNNGYWVLHHVGPKMVRRTGPEGVSRRYETPHRSLLTKSLEIIQLRHPSYRLIATKEKYPPAIQFQTLYNFPPVNDHRNFLVVFWHCTNTDSSRPVSNERPSDLSNRKIKKTYNNNHMWTNDELLYSIKSL